MHLGIDLDNTLALYDRAFHEAAVEARLVPTEFPVSKRAIREELRSRPGGETEWTRLQGSVYTGTMDRAVLAPGAERLLAACAARDVRVTVVSHKTQFPADGPRVDMRESARAWMARTACLAKLPVHFEATREAKVARIASLGCTHFVDDLIEVFEEPSFPREVVRILLDSRGDSAGNLEAYPDLDVVNDRLFGDDIAGEWDESELQRLAPGLHSPTVAGDLLHRGVNSTVYRVAPATGALLAAKAYPQADGDAHDRLGTEFGAGRFLWEHLVRKIAYPVSRSDEHGVGFYKYVDGERLVPERVTLGDVDQAIDFVLDLQRLRMYDGARRMPVAKEACFTIGAHISVLKNRFARLLKDLDARCEARDLLEAELRPALARVAETAGNPRAIVPVSERILSPSDFGFHNARRTPNGTLVFLDLEYFGWDDPAKLVCDSFLQPDFPIPAPHRERFLARLRLGLGLGWSFDARLRRLHPLLALKWALIVLNGFLPGRHLPAGWDATAQLDKARRALAAMDFEGVLAR